MRKLYLVLALTLLAIAIVSPAAFAAQAKTTGDATSEYYYSSTPTSKVVYGNAYGGETLFNADGSSNYPYEIYLPNEEFPMNYRIHTNYTKDTDACASCHATHTAVGASLLQWYSVYDTCMACHDGTVTTTYNVEEGVIGASGEPTMGGMFGNGSEGSLSKHNVDNTVNISAAPGGSTVAVSADQDGDGTTEVISWGLEFGCESCHSPHGQGGNARILHPDPNGYATTNAEDYYETGTWAEDFTGVADKDGDSDYELYVNGEAQTIITGYPYEPAFYNAGSAATVTVDNNSGVSEFTGTFDRVYATPSLKVTMDINNYLTGTEEVIHVGGMNTFCGACHTDYNTENVDESGSTLSGMFSQAYRHKVGVSDTARWTQRDYVNLDGFNATGMKLEAAGTVGDDTDDYMYCLTCHVAHGTSDSYWERTIEDSGEWLAADITMSEISGSSALKRAPNMTVCEACHEKGDAADGYLANSGQTYNQEVAVSDASSVHAAYFSDNTYQGTETCTEYCHVEADTQVMDTAHYQLAGVGASTRDFFGGTFEPRQGMSNRFCGFPAASGALAWAQWIDGVGYEGQYACGKCHVATGTEGPPNITGETGEIDCLICHADIEEYPGRMLQDGKWVIGTASDVALDGTGTPATQGELAELAKTVTKPTNENCMYCHEHAMEGDKYKRMTQTEEGYDAHADFYIECTDCHITIEHKIAKGKQATDLMSSDLPMVDVSCIDSRCHESKPHGDQSFTEARNIHTDALDCTACHISDSSAYSFFNWSAMASEDNTFAGGSDQINGPQVLHDPFNAAWRWYNGTGSGMANAYASFGLYDAKHDPQKGEIGVDKIKPFRKFQSVTPFDMTNMFMILPFDMEYVRENPDTLTDGLDEGTGAPTEPALQAKALERALNSDYWKMMYSKPMEEQVAAMAAEYPNPMTGQPFEYNHNPYMYLPETSPGSGIPDWSIVTDGMSDGSDNSAYNTGTGTWSEDAVWWGSSAGLIDGGNMMAAMAMGNNFADPAANDPNLYMAASTWTGDDVFDLSTGMPDMGVVQGGFDLNNDGNWDVFDITNDGITNYATAMWGAMPMDATLHMDHEIKGPDTTLASQFDTNMDGGVDFNGNTKPLYCDDCHEQALLNVSEADIVGSGASYDFNGDGDTGDSIPAMSYDQYLGAFQHSMDSNGDGVPDGNPTIPPLGSLITSGAVSYFDWVGLGYTDAEIDAFNAAAQADSAYAGGSRP